MEPPAALAFAEEPQPGPYTKQRKTKGNHHSDDEFNGSAVMEASGYDDDDSFSYKASKSKKPKAKSAAKSALHIFSDQGESASLEPPTPRTRHLLDIINSRDVALIKSLSGVGAKKARDLVEFLELGDEGLDIRSLQQLIAVPGLGKRTVERAYDGIATLLV
jgi:DNA uptake protein ComE-like DNA-binding protein